MKLFYIELCGFRGYRNSFRIEIAEDFTIIDGRNGVGKSTIFDAVEYALTGHLSKYKDAKADGETVADYIWWKGSGSPLEERYVEVGFRDEAGVISIRRSEFQAPQDADLLALAARLCDLDVAPSNPVSQLCATSIVRDEHITGLSLDLKETERYALLRDGLGAIDYDRWINRGASLLSAAKKRAQSAQNDVTVANSELSLATRRIDELRSKLAGDSTLVAAVERIRTLIGSELAPDQLVEPTREWIARTGEELTFLQKLASSWEEAERERARLPELGRAMDAAKEQLELATRSIDELAKKDDATTSSELAQQARALIALANLGRSLGLQAGHCPLCRAAQSKIHFDAGVTVAEEAAKKLDARAADEAKREQALLSAEGRLSAARRTLEDVEASVALAQKVVDEFDSLRAGSKAGQIQSLDQINGIAANLRIGVETAQRDLRVVETLKLNADLEHAKREESRAKERLAAAQERAGRARKAESSAHSLHDAARRAAGETLDRRLDRVLPLMSELYRRLRPHPVWTDIDYSIRGDVRKFLKLKVGDELNPQFLFSSGQRRATGLAFLLSANLSLAWSKWRTIMLDDPVQHVDDFRTVHLAELAAQLVEEGRQIVCSVEDAALADLLCRRLPIRGMATAKRVTLGSDNNGDFVISSERFLSPMAEGALLSDRLPQSAG